MRPAAGVYDGNPAMSSNVGNHSSDPAGPSLQGLRWDNTVGSSIAGI